MKAFANSPSELKDLIAKLQNDVKDTGSTAVQVCKAIFDIRRLTEHMKQYPKDKHTKRGLENLVSKYKKLLKYLKRTSSVEFYQKVISTLGIRG